MVYTHVSNAMYGDVKILIFYLYHKQHKLSLQSNLYIQGTVILECNITFLKFLAPATLFFSQTQLFVPNLFFHGGSILKLGCNSSINSFVLQIAQIAIYSWKLPHWSSFQLSVIKPKPNQLPTN